MRIGSENCHNRNKVNMINKAYEFKSAKGMKSTNQKVNALKLFPDTKVELKIDYSSHPLASQPY
ncbi:MAG: hypothetical protein JWP81_3717 [Ferruginibacter sp.]|nr:hypothetical protein [Ferruginibacter sp.]